MSPQSPWLDPTEHCSTQPRSCVASSRWHRRQPVASVVHEERLADLVPNIHSRCRTLECALRQIGPQHAQQRRRSLGRRHGDVIALPPTSASAHRRSDCGHVIGVTGNRHAEESLAHASDTVRERRGRSGWCNVGLDPTPRRTVCVWGGQAVEVIESRRRVPSCWLCSSPSPYPLASQWPMTYRARKLGRSDSTRQPALQQCQSVATRVG